ncbi:protein of unknown function [Mesorhizobium albiziae]|uniref:N-terminal domain-containing protein n=1 Tax=Neomesorhizobium albiziae TaxID=335020 RepID=A0A1I4EIF3_9HYPH|nr:ArdC-like ssDNA-binding domain-containing protein [Mesorhizobium albiziae]GLS32029.1 hypothetical protein GCM10007937_37390 [Mesorhizobium albiziae]SFL04993.1 protein of unknown function [Mesorhizobium albiziae]
MKAGVYERITSRVVAELEQRVRSWLKPWNAEHAAGRITRPLCSNGVPYQGINVEATGEEAEREIPFLKGYTVFNVEQVEGLPAHFYAVAEPRLDPVQRIDRAELFFAATGVAIRHGGSMTYYSAADDPSPCPVAARITSAKAVFVRCCQPSATETSS